MQSNKTISNSISNNTFYNSTFYSLQQDDPSPSEIFGELRDTFLSEISKVISAVSIVFNALNIVVLTRREMISPTSLILTAIAFADLFNSCIFLANVLATPDDGGPQSFLGAVYFAFAINATLTMHSISIWLGVVLSAYRYALLRKIPDTNKKFGTVTVKLSIILIYIVIPALLTRNYLRTSIIKNETSYIVDPNLESDVIQYWTYTLGLKVIPCVLMIVFGSCLLYSLRKLHLRRISLHYMHSQNRQNRERAHQNAHTPDASTPQTNGNGQPAARVEPAIAPRRLRERWKQYSRTTKLLVVIISVFVLTQLPQGLVLVWDLQIYKEYGPLFDIMSLLNNCISFALYCLMSEAFRRMFLRVFCSPFLRYFGERTNASSSTHRSARVSQPQPDDRSAVRFFPSFSSVSAIQPPNGTEEHQLVSISYSVKSEGICATNGISEDAEILTNKNGSPTERPKPSRPVSVPSMTYKCTASGQSSNISQNSRLSNSQRSRPKQLKTATTSRTVLSPNGFNKATPSSITTLPLETTTHESFVGSTNEHHKSNGEWTRKTNPEVRFVSRHAMASPPMPLVPPAIVIVDEDSDK